MTRGYKTTGNPVSTKDNTPGKQASLSPREGGRAVTKSPTLYESKQGVSQSCLNLSKMKRNSAAKEAMVPAGLGVEWRWKQLKPNKRQTQRSYPLYPPLSKPMTIKERKELP